MQRLAGEVNGYGNVVLYLQKGSNPSVYMDLSGKLYIDSIEVATDGPASRSDTEADRVGGGTATYLDLQGRLVRNHSGGAFIGRNCTFGVAVVTMSDVILVVIIKRKS